LRDIRLQSMAHELKHQLGLSQILGLWNSS
jgi:hypothetical protein